jgi:hypothetical protein
MTVTLTPEWSILCKKVDNSLIMLNEGLAGETISYTAKIKRVLQNFFCDTLFNFILG